MSDEWDEIDADDAQPLLRQLRRESARSFFGPKFDASTLLAITGNRCGICGGQLESQVRRDGTVWYEYQLDHILPLAAGGDHIAENLQPAHDYCNFSKSGRFLTTCALPPGSFSAHLRAKRAEREESDVHWRQVRLELIDLLALTDYLAGWIEFAENWQDAGPEEKAARWRERLEAVGPAPSEARDYIKTLTRRPTRFKNGVICGALMDDAFFSCLYYWDPDQRERNRASGSGGFHPKSAYGRWYNSWAGPTAGE